MLMMSSVYINSVNQSRERKGAKTERVQEGVNRQRPDFTTYDIYKGGREKERDQNVANSFQYVVPTFNFYNPTRDKAWSNSFNPK